MREEKDMVEKSGFKEFERIFFDFDGTIDVLNKFKDEAIKIAIDKNCRDVLRRSGSYHTYR